MRRGGPSTAPRSGTFTSLQVRNYRIYASGALLSNVGTWLQSTAQAWLVLQLTGSGAALGLTVALQLVPSLLLSPFAGVLADRVPKRTLLRWLQLGMAVPSALLGVLAITGVVQVWQVFVLTLLFGAARALEAPARQSFVAEMVGQEHLSNAVSLNSASFNSGRLVGPALAGVLIAAFGSGVEATGWVILANAISYGFVILALQLMDPTLLHPAPLTGDRRGAVRAGVRYVRSRPDLVLLFSVVFFLGSFGMNFAVTSALMATEEFGKGAGEFGLLGSIMAIGSLAGALLAARRPSPRLRFIVGAALVFAAVQLLSAVMPTYVTYAAVLPLVGLSVLTAVTTANALIQMSTDPAMRGRVASLYLMVFLGSVPLGAPVIGWLAEAFGARWALATSGIVVGLGVIASALYFLQHDAALRDALAQRRTRRRSRPASAPTEDALDLV
ncbi:MFS transporter [Aeromicrobium alkaliterrae]|uniref:MFS transporter n=1 Tax=Aeromicrobium alkaliterrae TaxID=302168 RepID=A0ABN2KB12_9ACTN